MRTSRARASALVAIAVVVVAIAVAWRIRLVNERAFSYPVETFVAGEEVALDGAFFEGSPPEDTTGYRIRVCSATRVTPREFVASHGGDGAALEVPGADVESVVDLELEISNDGDSEGMFSIFSALLIPATATDYLVETPELWAEVEPNVDAGQAVLSVRPHSTYVTHVPYAPNEGEETRYLGEVAAGEYRLDLSQMPVRKVVEVDVAP